jgi:signal transduction histidine kinase
MRLTASLRFRVAFAFAYQGAFFSLLLVVSLYLAIQNISHGLMDQSLQAELDQALERVAKGEPFDIPKSVTIQGYMRGATHPGSDVPAAVASLLPGHHNITIGEIDYRILVVEKDGSRYFLLFNTDLQHERESELLELLSIAAFVLTVISAVAGGWLAMRIVTPVTRLAEQVGRASPEEVDVAISKLTRDDEVGELARAFDRYAKRVHSFVEREKQFTGNISHELRTPLAVILAALEVLERDDRVMKIQGDRIERMKRTVMETGKLCEALLMLAREREQDTNEPGFDVADVLLNCIDRHRHLLAADRVKLEVHIVANPQLAVERTLLEVVFGNLLRNAFSYTHSGTVTVRLEADRFIVEDTGIGIRDADMDHIFEYQQRGESSTGEGIGLTLVKRICDRFAWSIRISSQEGYGTRAEIRFAAGAEALAGNVRS